MSREGGLSVLASSPRARIRLGQWMDWGNDYYTFSDTNIEYIWRFLKLCTSGASSTRATARPSGALAAAPRSPSTSSRRAACTRTSRSRRSSSGFRSTSDRASRSSSGRRLRGRFLPTSRRRSSRTPSTGCARTGSGSRSRAIPTTFVRASSAASSSARLPQALRRPRAAAEVDHRVIPWDEVSLDEGTGIVHIAPGAGQEDFELGRDPRSSRAHAGRRVGRFYDSYGWLHGLSTTEAADQIVGRLAETGFLLEAGMYSTAIRTAGAVTHR